MLLTQHRGQPRAAVKVAHVGIGQVQRVDAHIGRDWQALGLGLADQGDTRCAADATQVHARKGAAHQLKNRVQGNGFSGPLATRMGLSSVPVAAGGNALAQIKILRAQPDGVAKGAGVLQSPLHHLGVGQRNFSLTESHAAGGGELAHFGQDLALEAQGQSA